jgi:hypothetical protein
MSSVKVRPIADPAAAAYGAGDAISVARGQFMLGNVGLALEGFRKAQRYNPSDPAALEGIGDCYASMGRLDIAQSSYESALALAPHDPRLLLALADVLDHQGKAAQAAETRAEASGPTHHTASITVPLPPAERRAAVPVASIGSVTVKLPPVQPAPQLERVVAVTKPVSDVPAPPVIMANPVPRPATDMTAAVALPAAHTVGKLEGRPVSLPQQQFALPETPMVAPTVPAVVLPAVLPVSLPGANSSGQLDQRPLNLAEAHIVLPEPAQPTPPAPAASDDAVAPAAQQLEPQAAVLADRLIEHSNSVASNTPVAPPATHPVPAPARPPASPDRVAVLESPAPRLERLSSGEVALVTTGKPMWQPTPKVQMAAASSVRWVALANAPARPNVQILNAARSQGLASSARKVLSNRGWRRIAIGDAPATQHSSVVLYPENQAALGRRLAAQFGIAARMVKRNAVVLILGRDAVDRIGSQHRS